MNPIQRGQQMAQQVADVAGQADQVILAVYDPVDYPNVLAAGLVTCSFAEYRARLAGAILEFEQRGIPVITVPTTAQEMTDTIAAHGLPSTPDGRAAAIGIIYGARS